MENMNNNLKNVSKGLKTFIVIGVIALLVVVLVLVIVLTTKASKKTDENILPNTGETTTPSDDDNTQSGDQVTPDTGTETSTIPSSLSEYNYKCEKENVEEGVSYKQLLINYIKVEENQVKKAIDAVKIIYSDENEYSQLKELDADRAVPNDAEKSLEYIKADSKIDYMVDENGQELNIEYSKYKEALERSEYTCSEIVR